MPLVVEIFVDTSGWASLFDAGQPYHENASDLYKSSRQQGTRFATTNYVISELVALMASPLRIPRSKIVFFIDGLKSSSLIDIVNIDAGLDDQAWELYRQRQDKNWSLVDCASCVVMRQRGIQSALTSDHHFEQAGFAQLLK